MALHHAAPGEVVDLASWGDETPDSGTKAIVKTEKMELIRMVIPAGREISSHQLASPIVVHCLKGNLEFHAMGDTRTLEPGQLLYLEPNETHSLKACEEVEVLLTIVF